MAKGIDLGVGSVKPIKEIFAGIGGVKKIKEVYGGIAGAVKIIWSGMGFDKLVKLPNLAVMPTASTDCATFSPSGHMMVVILTGNRYMQIYIRSGDTYVRTGQVDIKKYSTSSYPATASFSSDGLFVCIGIDGLIVIFKVSGNTLTYVSEISERNGNVNCGKNFFVNHTYLYPGTSMGRSQINIYKHNGVDYSRVSNFELGLTGNIPRISQDDTYVFVGGYAYNVDGDSYASAIICKRDGNTYTQIQYIAGLYGDTVRTAIFSPDNNSLVVCSDTHIHLFTRSGDTFNLQVRYTESTNRNCIIDVSSDGNYFAILVRTVNRFKIYKKEGNTLVAMPAPAVLPNYELRSIAINPGEPHVAMTSTATPFLHLYKGE